MAATEDTVDGAVGPAGAGLGASTEPLVPAVSAELGALSALMESPLVSPRVVGPR